MSSGGLPVLLTTWYSFLFRGALRKLQSQNDLMKHRRHSSQGPSVMYCACAATLLPFLLVIRDLAPPELNERIRSHNFHQQTEDHRH